MTTRRIIVGTDGAESGKAAVRWAAREAQRRGAVLRIVHAFDWEWAEARYDYSGAVLDVAQKTAQAITANAADAAVAVAPGVFVETDTLLGRTSPRLLALAEDAQLMVLGNRGRGGFASLLLGSVSQHVATHAACPVVVVRGRPDIDGGPVSAGVDDSPAAQVVLATAFEAAATLGADLKLIRTYLPPVPLWMYGAMPASEVATPEFDADERERLNELVAPWTAKYPGVRVDTLLSHDSAAAVLAGVSHGSQLVVVGSHSHGGITGSVLGSTGLQLLHHADCPVHIAR
ncbi:universal stress protein [Actinoplanes sp. NPDC049265]|uniref:universal stress protein n=1 Tax=Actinoplanes sp. NPDC049265 TaxID=3363902 RepID=UPI003716EED6